MSVPGEWMRRLAYLLNRRKHDEALRQEIEAHRSMMSDPARFGSTLRSGEDARDVWGWRPVEQFWQDLRFGARTLVRAPAFAATAILTLGLASGATTAIFSFVNSVLLRPLPFEEPDRLVQVFGRTWQGGPVGGADPIDAPVATPQLEAFDTRSTSFENFAGYALTARHLQEGTGVERLTAVSAEPDLFQVLGVDAVAGRVFQPGDPLDVAVIAASLWARRFGRDPSLPGRTITLDGRPYTVLGVMPEQFQFPYSAASIMPGALPESRSEVWVPMPPRAAGTGAARMGRVDVVARMKRGVPLEAAAAEVRIISAQVEQESAGSSLRVDSRIVPLAARVTEPIRRSLWLLFAAAGLVLVAACANVANLLLARTTARVREVQTRSALGAARLRLARQFITESLLLSLLGGAAGVLVAIWSVDALVAAGAENIPRAHEVTLDWRAFAFLFAVCLGAALLFGLAPTLAAARTGAGSTAQAGRATAARPFTRLRDALVVLEVALAFVLALGAALVLGGVWRLRHAPTGMALDGVLTLHVTPRTSAADYYAIEERVASLGGVRAAGFTQLLPLQNWGWEADVSIRGRPPVPGDRPIAGLRYVTPGYFRALGIPIMQGRGITVRDGPEAPPVVLVNQAFARQYLPEGEAIGTVTSRGTIVGVVADVRNVSLDRPAGPELYYPAAQNVTMASDIGMTLVVRGEGNVSTLVDRIGAAVRDVNPSLAVFNVKTMEQVVADSMWEVRLYAWLIGLFAAITLVLAAIGLFGVMLYSVSMRVREFAVRLALGAEPGALVRLVFGRAIGLAAAGLAAGVTIAVAVQPATADLPIGFSLDFDTSASIAAVVLAIAVAASAIPARRAARVNPAAALRHE